MRVQYSKQIRILQKVIRIHRAIMIHGDLQCLIPRVETVKISFRRELSTLIINITVLKITRMKHHSTLAVEKLL
jgi:hypothetical protein